MKKLIASGVASLALLASAAGVFAGAKNSPYYAEWYWVNPDTGNPGYKSAYFLPTGSGLVNGWTYDHPDLGDARFVIKPLFKFSNATECDEGWVRERTDWKPRGIWSSALTADDKEAIEMAFGADNLDELHLFCAYPAE